MFWIPYRQKLSISNESGELRVSIRYWLGWPMFSFLVLWNYVNIESGYHQWINISNGIVGATSWEKLRLSEIFAVLGFCMLLWLIGGRERITIDSVRLQIRKEILGVGWSRNFQLADIKDIRSGWFFDLKAKGKGNPDYIRAALYFDCHSKTHSFGKELTTSDAIRIEEAIRKVFPQIVLNRG
jgi:hypothetical protein